MNQADWDIEVLEQFAAKEVAGRRETADGLWTALGPFAMEVVLRRTAAGLRHADEMDLRIVSRGDFFLCPANAGDRKLHVRLAGANPDLAHENVFELDLVLAGDRQRIRSTDGQRIEFDAPLAGRCVGASDLRLIADLHGDFLALIGPAPDRHRNIALEHGVFRKHRRQANIGRGPFGGDQQKAGNDSRKQIATETHERQPILLSVGIRHTDCAGYIASKAGLWRWDANFPHHSRCVGDTQSRVVFLEN